ncbi:MAG: hypothetical protein QNK85_04530 [Crocinitomicaceae bacterium]
MYKLIFSLLFVGFISTNINAQNKKGKSDDLGRIVLNSYIAPQAEAIPSHAKRMLLNKLSQVTSYNGMGGSSLNPRFILTPNITVLTKDITPTAPPMHALTLEVTFYIGDGIDGKLFANSSLQIKGVGQNENKAYIAALKRINPKNPALKDLIVEGKEKIIEFYNSQCDFFIKEAKTLEGQNKFEAAILKLTSVPDVCKECYDKCMDAVAPIYQKQIDRECKMKLAEAKNAWSTGQDAAGADNASEYLAGIDPNASCFGEVKKLTSQIAARIKALDQREWNFKLKQQQDDVNIQKATIKAARDIGVAYGNNQPDVNVTYNTVGWW